MKEKMLTEFSEIWADEWNSAVAEMIKAHMKVAGVNYVELARRLRRYGFDDGNRTLSGRINRGRFSAAFMLQCLGALGVETLNVPLGAENGAPGTKPSRRNQVAGLQAPSGGEEERAGSVGHAAS